MAFIELTEASGKKVFVNTRNIVFVKMGQGEDRIFTHIAAVYESVWVKETVEQVIEKIKEAK